MSQGPFSPPPFTNEGTFTAQGLSRLLRETFRENKFPSDYNEHDEEVVHCLASDLVLKDALVIMLRMHSKLSPSPRPEWCKAVVTHSDILQCECHAVQAHSSATSHCLYAQITVCLIQ